jgi:hypothetical protein
MPKVTEFSALAVTVAAVPFYATGCIQIAIISTGRFEPLAAIMRGNAVASKKVQWSRPRQQRQGLQCLREKSV